MKEKTGLDKIIFSQFEYALSVIEKCTDDYIFIMDFKNDIYSISEAALKRFPLPSAKFDNVTAVLKEIIYPTDYDMIAVNLDEISRGLTKEHNFEYRWKTKDGSYAWISCRGQVVPDENGNAEYLAGRISEIGALKIADNVTGLLTDVQLNKDYEKLLNSKKSFSGYLMQLKIDNFGELNRRYGKTTGDEILKIVAEITEGCISENDKLYRYVNSSFLLLNTDDGKTEDAKEIYCKIRKAIEKSLKDFDYKLFFTISAGIVEIERDNPLPLEELYKKAEFSIYKATKNERNNLLIFADSDYQNYIRQLEIQENLRENINQGFGGFELYYQPIIEAHTQEIVGAEALLRWQSEKYGRMSPVEFIPILEESGLIVPVGKWIATTAIEQCLQWQKYIKNFKVNINISYVQLKTSDVLNDINVIVDEKKLKPHYVVIEITESGNLDIDNTLVEGFRNKNFRLAIDDFGTGYSNIRYLQYLNVNVIKIDRSFVERATKSTYDYKIIKHIIDMAHGVNIEVCLEGIETEEELNTLLPLKPDYLQGYYFGRPVPKDEFFELHLKGKV